MGTEASDSVVNQKFQVHGVSNLRVVDCGVLPTHISGCSSRAVSMLLAERCASFILKDTTNMVKE